MIAFLQIFLGTYRFGDAEKQDFVDTCIPHMVPQYKVWQDYHLSLVVKQYEGMILQEYL